MIKLRGDVDNGDVGKGRASLKYVFNLWLWIKRYVGE